MSKRIFLFAAMFVVTSAFIGGLFEPGVAQAGGGLPTVSLTTNVGSVTYYDRPTLTVTASNIGGLSGISVAKVDANHNPDNSGLSNFWFSTCNGRSTCTFTVRPEFYSQDANKTVRFVAYAVDLANHAVISSDVTISVLPVATDSVAPTVGMIINSNELLIYSHNQVHEGEWLEMSANASDVGGSGVTNITIYEKNNATGIKTAKLSCTNRTTCIYSYRVSSIASAYSYTYYAEARDNAGNVGKSTDQTLDFLPASHPIGTVLSLTASRSGVAYNGTSFDPLSLSVAVNTSYNYNFSQIVVERIKGNGELDTAGGNSWTFSCNGYQSCPHVMSPTFTVNDIGKTIMFRASVNGAAGSYVAYVSVPVWSNVQVDTIAPTVSLFSSINQVNYNQYFSLNANASDSQSGVHTIKIYEISIGGNRGGGEMLLKECHDVLSCSVDLSGGSQSSNTPHYYMAEATDKSGNTQQSSSVIVTFLANNTDRVAPTVTLTPSRTVVNWNGSTFESLTLTLDARDNVGLYDLIGIRQSDVNGNTIFGANNWDTYTCHNKTSCQYTVTPTLNQSMVGSNIYFFAFANDLSNNVTKGGVITIRINNTSVTSDTTAPTLTLNTSRSVVNYNGTSFDPLTLTVSANDTVGMREVRIERVAANGTLDTANGNSWTMNCVMPGGTYALNCTRTVSPAFSTNDINKTIYYRATAYDAAGNHADRTISVMVYPADFVFPMPTPTGALTVSNSITPGVSNGNISIAANAKATGRATSKNGVWGIETRMTTSWSSTVVKNRCILSGNPTDGQCVLDVGNSIKDHVGGTVKIWSIAWDAKTGMGADSAVTSLTVVR